jgi:hypothetical protein
MITSTEGLAIAVIIYYAIALPLSIKICMKHGFGRHAGWLYLLIMPVVRIVGAALTIAATQNPSTGLYTAAGVFSAIGLGPLLLALVGIVKRVYVLSIISDLNFANLSQ